jgi:arylsulfatase A-like enzyme
LRGYSLTYKVRVTPTGQRTFESDEQPFRNEQGARRNFKRLLIVTLLVGSLEQAALGGKADHVVVVVWDGLRPDYVSAQYTPNLNQLARQGTFFKQNHSCYVTSTEVNGTALATGMYPDHSGVVANVQYRPELNWLSSYGTESLDAIRRGDLLTEGHYVGASTMAEILQQAGIATITAGAKPVVLLQDRKSNKVTPAQKKSVTLFRGQALPRSILQSLQENPEIGPFPKEQTEPDTKQGRVLNWVRKGRDEVLKWLNGKPKTPPLARLVNEWTTKALVRGLWKEGVPKYTLLWLSEPDASQHESGVGSENAEAGLEACDNDLALVIKTLKDKGAFDSTDLMVVSDHGFSTIDRGPDVVGSLKRAHFVADKQFENPEAGDLMVVSLGGSTAFYVFDHDELTVRKLVEFLQETDYAGVIFSSITVEGTFPLSQVHVDAHAGAPDVLVSMRWSADRNDWGAPGLVTAAEGKRGRGTHASLSRYDLHNTLIACGPDFKQGYTSDVPSGNVDVAPTVLAILGVAPSRPMDGRVLSEAMVENTDPAAKPEGQTLEAYRDLGFRQWHQYLKLSRVGSVVYYDEGNGESRLK